MREDRTSFGRRLRSELTKQDVSVRELARRLKPEDPESARRNIARWLAPRERAVTPGAATIARVAAELGVEPRELRGDDTDEDEARSMTLDDILRMRIRQIMREEQGALA